MPGFYEVASAGKMTHADENLGHLRWWLEILLGFSRLRNHSKVGNFSIFVWPHDATCAGQHGNPTSL